MMKNQKDIESKLDRYIAESETVIQEIFARVLKMILESFTLSYVKYSKEDDSHITWTEFNKYNRYNKMLDKMGDMLDDEFKQIKQEIKETQQAVYLDGFMSHMYLIEQTSDIQMSFTLPDDKVIQKALNQPVEKINLDKTLEKHRNKVLERIRVHTSTGLMGGNSYNEIAETIKKDVGMTERQARLVARTEGGRSQSQAQVDAEDVAKENGARIKGYWDATLDSRTRPSHAHHDGMEEDENGNFTVGLSTGKAPRLLIGVDSAKQNINCRCKKLYTVNGMRPQIRASRDKNNKTKQIPYVTYMDWYKERTGKEYPYKPNGKKKRRQS